MPDFNRYYIAVVLARVMDWSKKESEKRWVNIEHNLSNTNLGHVLWNPPKFRALSSNTTVLTRNTFKYWDLIHKRNKWTYNSPLIYMKNNILFEPGKREVGGNWLKDDCIQLKNFLSKGRICTLDELRKEPELWVIDEWRFLQLSHFIDKLPKPLRSEDEYRQLERFCTRGQTGGEIAQLYRILGMEMELEEPPYIKRWEQELGLQCSKALLEKILQLVHYSALDIRRTETHYKCLARWYATPDRLSKMDNSKSSACWRGCRGLETMTHMWWNCPIIRIYWKKIIALIKEITGEEIAEDPWVCLFHGTTLSVKRYRSSLVPIMLDAAKRQIAQKWRELPNPNIRDWLLNINEIYNIECLDERGQVPDEGEERTGKWAGWQGFKRSWSYLEEIINIE